MQNHYRAQQEQHSLIQRSRAPCSVPLCVIITTELITFELDPITDWLQVFCLIEIWVHFYCLLILISRSSVDHKYNCTLTLCKTGDHSSWLLVVSLASFSTDFRPIIKYNVPDNRSPNTMNSMANVATSPIATVWPLMTAFILS